MKDQVILGANGELAIAVPLFRLVEVDVVAKIDGHTFQLTSEKPLAYVIDMNTGNCPIVNALILEKQVEFLGDL